MWSQAEGQLITPAPYMKAQAQEKAGSLPSQHVVWHNVPINPSNLQTRGWDKCKGFYAGALGTVTHTFAQQAGRQLHLHCECVSALDCPPAAG